MKIFEEFRHELLNENFKLLIDRNCLRKVWRNSKNDMQKGKETLGLLRMRWMRTKKIIKPYIFDAYEFIGGLGEEEIRKLKLNYLVQGLVILPHERIREHLYSKYPYMAFIHTHPPIEIFKFEDGDMVNFSIPPFSSDLDRATYASLSERLAKVLCKDHFFLFAGLTTCFAEGKILFDTIFHRILSKIIDLDAMEIKRAVFEEEHENKYLNHALSVSNVECGLGKIVHHVTRNDFGAVIKLANKFCRCLKEKGYTNEPKIPGGLYSEVLHWKERTQLLWKIAEEEVLNSNFSSNFDMIVYKNGEILLYPLVFNENGSMVRYTGKSIRYPEVEEFKRMYRKKFGKDFMGTLRLNDEINELFPELSEGEKVYSIYQSLIRQKLSKLLS